MKVENIYCKECKGKTKHVYLGMGIPKQVRWKCTECGEYNLKQEDE